MMEVDEKHVVLESYVLNNSDEISRFKVLKYPMSFALLFATDDFDVHRFLSDLPDIPLLGADVPAFICDGKVHEHGAMLLIIHSNQLNVEMVQVAIRSDHSIKATLDSTLGEKKLASTTLFAFAPSEFLNEPIATMITQDLTAFSGGRFGVLGGGASRLDGNPSRVYFNKEITTESIVIAALNTNLKSSSGSCDGVVPIDGEPFKAVFRLDEQHARSVRIRKPHFSSKAKSTRTVDLEEILSGINLPAIQSTSGQVIVGKNKQLPKLFMNNVGETFRVVQPNGREMAVNVGRLHEGILNQIDTAPDQVEAVLAFGSFLRYKHRNETGFRVDDALKSVRRSFPKAEFFGIYLNGEFRKDSFENLCITHWSLSEFAIANEILEHAHERLIGQALVDCVQSGRLGFLDNAIHNALQIVVDSGFPKCMLSLVYENGDDKCIVATAAHGKNWQETILPATRRRLNDGDILELIVTSGNLVFVRDAQTDARCKNELAARAGVISFAGVPVFNQDAKVVGVLQIDLGDSRGLEALSGSQEFNLKRVGSLVSLLVNQAMLAQEVGFTRKLDGILEACLVHEHWAGAYQSFVLYVARLMNADVLIRLLDKDNHSLRLIGGIGKYFESSLDHRQVVRLNEQDTMSGAVIAAKSEFPHVVNDTAKDPRHQSKVERYRGTSLGAALEEIQSHADFKIACPNGRLIGTVSLLSTEKWFFDQAIIKSWQDIGKRLSVLHELMEQKAAKNHHLVQLQLINAKLEFINQITPPIELKQSSHEALQAQVTHIASSSKADVVSCYLKDASVNRYVLRAQYGWEDDRWLDAAWLDTNIETIPKMQTMLGRLGKERNLDLMFGAKLSATGKYDLIHIPLIFKGDQIGVMLLHKLRDIDGEHGFSELGFIDDTVLREASEILSAFAKALIEHDQTKWEKAELSRKQGVLRRLNDPILARTSDTFKRFCEGVSDIYRFKACRVYARRPIGNEQAFFVAGSNVPHELGNRPSDEVFTVILQRVARNFCNGPATDSGQPDLVRNEGQVTRFIVPVTREEKVVVIVDFEWQGMLVRDHHDVLPHHDEQSLIDLSERFADMLITEQLKRREELSFAANDGISLRLRERYHELSNALVAIEENLKKVSDSEARSKIESIVDSELKYFNTIKHSTQRVINRANRCDLSIKQLVLDAVKSHQKKIVEYKCQIDIELAEFNATVDRSLMEESFRGLVSNALKACRARWNRETGGIVKIRLTEDRSAAVWKLEIKDNGKDYRNSNIPQWGVGLDLTHICCAIHDGKFEIDSSHEGFCCRMIVPFHDTTTGLLDFDLG